LGRIRPYRRILIIGEGRQTEYNYFVGFRHHFEDELKAAATSVKVQRGKGGGALAIVKNTVKEAKRFGPVSRNGDRVFLLMDTEAGERESEWPDAESLTRKHKIEIVYSCPAFEYWLLCHFDKPPRRYLENCTAVEVELNKKWTGVSKAAYDKADRDVFTRLSNQVNVACTQALETDLHHLTSRATASRANPSTQIYELIAILIGVKTGQRCPLSGTWKPSNHSKSQTLNKGETVPQHAGNDVTWHL